jgi:hypothetical protein
VIEREACRKRQAFDAKIDELKRKQNSHGQHERSSRAPTEIIDDDDEEERTSQTQTFK